MTRAGAAILFAILAAPGFSREPAALPAGATALSGEDGGSDDLAPLSRMLRNAKVAALGEPLHTSDGFYRVKARIIRRLVEKDGYRVVAFETPWRAAEATARFVAGGDVRIESALRGLYGVWRSDSVRDLLVWLRSYNEAHPKDTVQFVGFDVQQPRDDLAVLREFLRRERPERADVLLGGLSVCSAASAAPATGRMRSAEAGPIRADALEECLKAISAVRVGAGLAGAHGSYAGDRLRADLALLGLESWETSVFLEGRNAPSSALDVLEPRDQAMAEVFLALRGADFPRSKAIIWAANYHIARGAAETVLLPSGAAQVHMERMGTVLSARLGDAYAPVAFIGYDVRASWKSIVDQSMPPAPSSLEAKLQGLGPLLLDLDKSEWGAAGVAIEGISIPCYSLRRDFRALVYLERSPAARMLEVEASDVRPVRSE